MTGRADILYVRRPRPRHRAGHAVRRIPRYCRIDLQGRVRAHDGALWRDARDVSNPGPIVPHDRHAAAIPVCNRLAVLVGSLALLVGASACSGGSSPRSVSTTSSSVSSSRVPSTSAAPTTTTTETPVQVHVVNCPIPPSDYGGTPIPPGSPPSTLSVAPSLVPPEGASLYGTEVPGGGVAYLIGPTSAKCEGHYFNADGGLIIATTSTRSQSQGVTMTLRAGGAGPSTDLACPYIPAVLAADRAMRGSYFTSSSCSHPSADLVQQIDTGITDLYAAVVSVPATVKDPNLATSGDGTDPTVAFYIAWAQTDAANGEAIACTLPPAQRNICTTSLEYFASTVTNVGTTPVTNDAHQRMQMALSTFLSGR